MSTGVSRPSIGQVAALADSRTALEGVERLHQYGCRIVEVALGAPEYFDGFNAYQVAQLKRSLRSRGMTINSVHSSFIAGSDIASTDSDEQRAALLLQRQTVLLAAELGARHNIVHPSLPWTDDDRKDRLDRSADAIAMLADEAIRCGVVIAVENMLGDNIGRTEEEILHLIGRADPSGCGVCFDVGHANLHGRVIELASALLPKTVTTHLHDNEGTADQHLFPGKGTVDWAALGQVYKETGCCAQLLVESRYKEHENWSAAEQWILAAMGLAEPQ